LVQDVGEGTMYGSCNGGISRRACCDVDGAVESACLRFCSLVEAAVLMAGISQCMAMFPVAALLLPCLFITGCVDKTVDLIPPCRKSAILETQTLGDGVSHALMSFGGKGALWMQNKHHVMQLSATSGDWLQNTSHPALDTSLAAKGKQKNKGETKKLRYLADTWTFELKRKKWQQVKLLDSLVPAARWKHGTTMLDNGFTFVVFGGCPGKDIRNVFQDLWVLSFSQLSPPQGRWQRIETEKTPKGRRGHVLVANSSHLLVFGGKAASDGQYKPEVLNDLWSLPCSALRGGNIGTWVQGASLPATARWGGTGTMVSLPDGKQLMAYFGGRHYGATRHSYIYMADLWVYNPVTNSWNLAAPKGGVQPQGRDHHGATAIGSTLYLYGGRANEAKAVSALLGDLWSYSFATNTWKQLSNFGRETPGPRYQTGIASIPVGDSLYPDGAIALFAGGAAPRSTKQSSSNDVWVYPVAGWGWNRLSKSHCSWKYTGNLLEAPEAAPVTIDSTLLAGATAAAASALFLVVLAARFYHRALRQDKEDKSEQGRCYHSLAQ